MWNQAYLVLDSFLSAIYFLSYHSKLFNLSEFQFQDGDKTTLLGTCEPKWKDNINKEHLDTWPICS